MLEKFSAVVWRCSRYLQGPPNIALRSRKRITTIRLVDKKYSRKTKIWSQKKLYPAYHCTASGISNARSIKSMWCVKRKLEPKKRRTSKILLLRRIFKQTLRYMFENLSHTFARFLQSWLSAWTSSKKIRFLKIRLRILKKKFFSAERIWKLQKLPLVAEERKKFVEIIQ